jgi:hypothetical protein
MIDAAGLLDTALDVVKKQGIRNPVQALTMAAELLGEDACDGAGAMRHLAATTQPGSFAVWAMTPPTVEEAAAILEEALVAAQVSG